VTYQSSYDVVLRRLEYITVSLGEVAVEARDTGRDIMIEFRGMTSTRILVLNELVSVWGTKLYTESGLETGRRMIDSWTVFGSTGLDDGSPTEGDMAAAVCRASAWIFHMRLCCKDVSCWAGNEVFIVQWDSMTLKRGGCYILLHGDFQVLVFGERKVTLWRG